MTRLVLDLWHAGIRRVTGDIVVDESFFDGVREGPGWDQENSDRAYIAPTSAVSLNRNAVAIHVRPGASPGAAAHVSVDPESDFFVIDNRVVTAGPRARARHRPSSIAEGHRQRILVRGVQPAGRPGRTYWRRIDDPPRYFAHTFRAFMRQQGVRIDGRRIRLASVPDRAVRIHTAYSEPLSEVIGPLNKVSNNHVAEMLLKTIGAEIRGIPGSFESGADAVAEYLEREMGWPRGSYVYRNGSGLNDVNRVSARQMTGLLGAMWTRWHASPEFMTSLPVSGRDGTTRWRMDAAQGWIRAKTGTLENVSALSGYVGLPSGEVLAFSVIVNDHPGPYRTLIAGIDGVPLRLAAFGGVEAPGPMRPGARPASDSVIDLDERAALYLALSAASDPRNARYLLQAFEAEPDPLLRAVAAEALYRSDARLGAGPLLEAFDPSPETLGRLRRLTARDGEPLPVVAALADLAAQGREPALVALLKAAKIAAGDGALQTWFAETLVDVGRAAPEELLAALLEVEGTTGREAVSLLATGLRQENGSGPVLADARHPFREALRTAAQTPARAEAPTPAERAAAALYEELARLVDGDAEVEGAGEAGDEPSEGEEEGRSGLPTASVDPHFPEGGPVPGGGTE
jgi:serine-type D-Ala-D-Ala carboxypeptidase/endopeptidase (penicillin-binding protein 4)